MRYAPAVRRTESRKRNRSSAQGVDEAGPLMLTTNRIVRIPDALEPRMGPQVINVPVRPLRYPPMVRNSGADASWPQGTANINVETSSQS